jgi:hypothetical protein
LSVRVNVVPLQARWNDTIEVNLTLLGTGYLLAPNNIDAILCTDRSGSMLEDYPDRMVDVKSATKVFNGQMSILDRVAIVTFGASGAAYICPRKTSVSPERWSWTSVYGYDSGNPTYHSGSGWYNARSDNNLECYTGNSYRTTSLHHQYAALYYNGDGGVGRQDYISYATADIGLSFDKSTVNSTIMKTVPAGGTPMREALRVSIDQLKNNPRAYVVKAIILLSDGDYNWYGDPLARGTGSTSDPTGYGTLTSNYYSYSSGVTSQNMSRYAVDNSIRIYTIAFADSISTGGRDTLRKLAVTSGGKYYEASATNIGDVYTAIAGELKENAGVGVSTEMDFTDVSVSTNTSTWSISGSEGFNYIPYTNDRLYWFNETTIYNRTRDDTTNWSQNILNFNIGTIKIDQGWQSNFKLQLKPQANNVGQIELFGNDSRINFNNGMYVIIPTTYISCIGNESGTSVLMESAAYTSLNFEYNGTILKWRFDRQLIINDTVKETWHRNWTEEYIVGISNAIWPWRTMKQIVVLKNTSIYSGEFTLDVKDIVENKPFSGYVDFKVIGTDAKDGGNLLAEKQLTGEIYSFTPINVIPTPTIAYIDPKDERNKTIRLL